MKFRILSSCLLLLPFVVAAHPTGDEAPERYHVLEEQGAPGLSTEVLDLALQATACAVDRDLVKKQVLTVIDY